MHITSTTCKGTTSPENALNLRYMSILQLITRLVHKDLFPGLSHARGKYPQPFCHSNTKPSITESPEGDPTEIPDAGLRSRTPESECPPPTQRSSVASPRTSLASGKLPTRRRAFPLCRRECYHCCRCTRLRCPRLDCPPAC